MESDSNSPVLYAVDRRTWLTRGIASNIPWNKGTIKGRTQHNIGFSFAEGRTVGKERDEPIREGHFFVKVANVKNSFVSSFVQQRIPELVSPLLVIVGSMNMSDQYASIFNTESETDLGSWVWAASGATHKPLQAIVTRPAGGFSKT